MEMENPYPQFVSLQQRAAGQQAEGANLDTEKELWLVVRGLPTRNLFSTGGMFHGMWFR